MKNMKKFEAKIDSFQNGINSGLIKRSLAATLAAELAIESGKPLLRLSRWNPTPGGGFMNGKDLPLAGRTVKEVREDIISWNRIWTCLDLIIEELRQED